MSGPNHELWLNEHPTGAGLIVTYPVVNQSNSAPRARYMSNMGHRPGDLPHPVPVRYRFLFYLGTPPVDSELSEGPHRTSKESKLLWQSTYCRGYSDDPWSTTARVSRSGGSCMSPRLSLGTYNLTDFKPQLPNDGPPSRAPHPDYVAGPSEGSFGAVHSGMSVAEDLKRLASQYLSRPDSHVDKLRMKRSRSGSLKVLILLEVEDSDAI